jgi:dipeptidase
VYILAIASLTLAALLLLPSAARASCTSFGFGKRATASGAVMVSHSVDGWYDHRLSYVAGGDFGPDAKERISGDTCTATRVEIPIRELGEIPQAPHTHGYFHIGYPFLNEKGLSIGEHTWTGRDEQIAPNGLFYIANLQILGLKRANSARECVEIMGALASEHGYRDIGECLIVGDENEAWVFEICGPGKDWTKESGRPGAMWVARRVPDDSFFVGANRSRMGVIDFGAPDTIAGPGLREYAAEAGLWQEGTPFNYTEIFNPQPNRARFYSSRREWRALSILAPSGSWEPLDDTQPYPTFIKPDKPVSFEDLRALYSDHYEGTQFDQTKGPAAGPFGNPTRWSQEQKDLPEDMKGLDWERPIAIFRCSYSFIAEIRSDLPEPIRTCLWMGLDAQDTTVYTPIYNGLRNVPRSWSEGSQARFSRESAWWAFNLVRNWACLRWDSMYEEIKARSGELESAFRALQPHFEAAVSEMYERDEGAAASMADMYSREKMESVCSRWWEFAEYLISRYHNGMKLTPEGARANPGYPAEWLRAAGFGEHIRKYREGLEKQSK